MTRCEAVVTRNNEARGQIFGAEMSAGRIVIATRGGRTGKKIHLSIAGGSGAFCGHWYRYGAQHFKVNPATVRDEHLCEKCFPAEEAK